MADFPEAEMIDANGIRLAVHRAGPIPGEGRATLLFLHGFPELAYSWRKQFPAMAAAGYSVLAPDLRGYGASDKPLGQPAYEMREIVADIKGLLDHYGVERVIVVGHDWGSLICWSLPFYMPERLLGIANLNIPFLPRGALPPPTLFKHAFGERMYIVRFQETGVCEAIFERDMDRTMRFFMRRPKPGSDQGGGAFSTPDLDLVGWLEGPEEQWPGEPFLPEEELAVYIKAFRKGGMTAPLHYYRSMDRNWQAMEKWQPAGVPSEKPDVPALMITAGRDGVCPPRLADGIELFFSRYSRVDIPDSGHWTQQEKPDAVNKALLDWLESRVLTGHR